MKLHLVKEFSEDMCDDLYDSAPRVLRRPSFKTDEEHDRDLARREQQRRERNIQVLRTLKEATNGK